MEHVLTFAQQVLVLQARKIASTYPPGVRDQYMQAAEELRAPFWDWAADATVPAVTVPPKMKVKFPNGQGVGEREVDNPLFTFKIPQSVVDGEYGSFDSDNRNTTMRCPAPQSYPNSANDLLSQRPYKDWVVSSDLCSVCRSCLLTVLASTMHLLVRTISQNSRR